MEPPRKRRPEPESAAVGRTAPRKAAPPMSAVPLLRRQRRPIQRMPGPRFTGLGCGLLSTLVMLTVGLLDSLLLDASAFAYGLLFVLVCAACGLWVRRSDLLTAPISAPIAFAVGLQPISGSEGGVGNQVVAVFTQLALQAGWLYGGTLTACLVVAVRKVLMPGDRAAARRGQSPTGSATSAERPQRA